MDNILRKFGSMPKDRKDSIIEIQNSIILTPDFVLNFGKDSLETLTNTLDSAVLIIGANLEKADIEAMQKNYQRLIDVLSDVVCELENYVLAAEFFLMGKKTKDVFTDYHNLSLSDKIQFRNVQMLMDMLEEKSVSLLRASILASQSKIQLIISKDMLKNIEKGTE